MEVTGYIALIAVGILLGLTGGGGSMLSVPILVYLFSLDVFLASAYSFFIVGMTSLIGAWQKTKENLIDRRAAALFGIPSLGATFFSRKWLIPAIPEVVFQTPEWVVTKGDLFLGLLATLILAAGIMILFKVNASCSPEPGSRDYVLVPAGIATGLVAGLGGIGGGFLILPALLLFNRIPFKKAAGTALLIVAANSLSGFLGDICNYTLDWYFLSSITCLTVTGIMIGNFSIHLISTVHLQRAVGWLTMVLGLLMLWFELRG